jgi:hypothetical protein
MKNRWIYGVAVWGLISCQPAPQPLDGQALAQQHCVGCHSFPTPQLLDSTTWYRYLLPRMGAFLGHYTDSLSRSSLLEEGTGGERVEAAGFFPEQPVIALDHWEAIRNYYLTHAPKRPLKAPEVAVGKTFPWQAIRPAFGLQPPSTTFLGRTGAGQVLLGDAMTGSLYVLGRRLELLGQAKTGETPVWVTEEEGAYWVTVMGSFSPTDAPKGSLLALPKDGKGGARTLIAGLQRPVHHVVGDWNGDGRKDVVVCEFGKWTGGLTLFTAREDGTFDRTVLLQQSGATKALATDWDRDGHLDLLALFAQGNEGIYWLRNRGDGTFETKVLKRFHPSMGSSFLALKDWDGDGREDLVYCAGDQADFPAIDKAYQGVYLWRRGQGDGLGDSIFLPLRGAYAAEVGDFNLDGQMDVAAISFFPDFNEQQPRGMAFFKGTQSGFEVSSFPEVGFGRWVVMHAADLEGDGDIDLLLGSLVMEVPGQEDLVQGWIDRGISMVVLENTTR